MSPTDPSRLIARDLAERTVQVERIGDPVTNTDVEKLTADAVRWRRIAALMREIDEAKRSAPNVLKAENFQGMDDDDLLDLALKALRDFPILVEGRHNYIRVVDRLRRHGWTGEPLDAIDDAARKLVQRAQLLDVFEAVNAVAGPNVWLKQMREAIEQMEHNDGDSMLDLLSRALDARGTVDDLNGVWDTTGSDEGGALGETGDCGDARGM